MGLVLYTNVGLVKTMIVVLLIVIVSRLVTAHKLHLISSIAGLWFCSNPGSIDVHCFILSFRNALNIVKDDLLNQRDAMKA